MVGSEQWAVRERRGKKLSELPTAHFHRLKRNGVSILLQLFHCDARRLAERLEAIEFTFLLPVPDERLGLLRRQAHRLRDLVSRGHVYIDSPVMLDKIVEDGSKFLLGSFGSQIDHLVGRLFPLSATPPGSGDAVKGMA